MTMLELGRPHAPGIPPAIRDRLTVTETSSGTFCYLWSGELTERGYGRVTIRGRHQRVHRVAYAAAVGPIPPGMVLGHTCHDDDPTCTAGDACVHRRCANPAHLLPMTPSANVRAGRRPRHGTCRNGHDVTTPGALYVRPDGETECRACRAAARRVSAA